MAEFDLYYWPVPFRGQFIRAILAYSDCTWREHDAESIGALMGRDVDQQPIAFMGPPVLIDRDRQFAISQMPAIAFYLAERFDLLPQTPEARALSLKVVNDANDVIDELTLDGGREMWTPEKWQDFTPRLQKWMTIFEDTGRRHGLTSESGFMLGTENATVADIVTAVLWNTMAERFLPISDLLKRTSPFIWGLSQRMMRDERLDKLRLQAFADYGQSYCGGEIEKSLRSVTN